MVATFVTMYMRGKLTGNWKTRERKEKKSREKKRRTN